ncbi:MAG TPA: ATP-binding protein [Candidatus Polarisedimenticolia bacterium]|nr:ATP-binding protein [Candidatus Polarisedimenticolia bacterium]
MPRQMARLEIRGSDGLTRVVAVDRTPFSIGSDRSATLPLPAPGIAPIHAQIVQFGGEHHLVPHPSGTGQLRVDGSPVPEGGIALTHGMRIDLAPGSPYTLRFLILGARAEDREDRLVTLMEVARTITSSLAVEDVLYRVLDGAVRFSGAERGYLFLKEGEQLVQWRRSSEEADRAEVSLSVVEEVAATGRPVYRDVASGDRGQLSTDSIVRLRLQAILCLPLAIRQDVIGVVYLDSRKRLPHHQPDLHLLEALAGLAAVAIQNSHLVEERVRAERVLAIGQMARAVVHDLRSPLSSIRGLAELLRERAPEGDPSRPHLATIMAEADRLAGITGDLLQFSREAPPLQRLPVPLADLVRQTIQPLQPLLQRSNISLALILDEDARASVDAARILRVLHNLVTNSLEAMRSGGLLEIRCGRANGSCHLSVRDGGCGMSEEVRRRVFEPFFTHGKAHGTGLGMAIVQRIVAEHGGSIRIDSTPGQGTTIELILPAAGPAAARA